MAYVFRSVTGADLPLLRDWRSRPHVREWWGPPQSDDPSEILSDGCVAMWIVEHGGKPLAYAQDYSPHDWDNHPFAHLPPRSRGIDSDLAGADVSHLTRSTTVLVSPSTTEIATKLTRRRARNRWTIHITAMIRVNPSARPISGE